MLNNARETTTKISTAKDKIVNKAKDAIVENVAEGLVEHGVPTSVLIKAEEQAARKAAKEAARKLSLPPKKPLRLPAPTKPLQLSAPVAGERIKILVSDTNGTERLQQSMKQVSDIVSNISDTLKDNYYEVNGFKFTQFYYDRLWDNGRKCPGFRAESVLRGATIIVPDPQGYEGFFRYIYNDWEMIFNPSTKIVSHLSPISSAKKKLI